LLEKVGPLTTFSWITLKFNVFCWDKYYFSESLGCKLIENYDGYKNILLFFQRIVKQSKNVRHPTCLETKSILILNFPQISTKYPPKNQKRIIFHKFKQFWWIWSFMPMSNMNLFWNNHVISPKKSEFSSVLKKLTRKLLESLRLKNPINILERKFVPWFDFSCLSGPKALSEKLFRPKISHKAKSN
jgi:hypothetical protein